MKFYRSFNAIYGRVGSFAAEDVTMHLVNTKCLPILLYSIESCPLLSRDVQSLDFSVNRVIMKVFRTGSSTVINECRNFFGVLPMVDTINIRAYTFLFNFALYNNSVCSCFASHARALCSRIRLRYGIDFDCAPHHLKRLLFLPLNER